MQVDGTSLVWPGRCLICLYDGTVRFGADFFPDPRGATVPDSVALPVQAYLLQTDGAAPLLIDTGSGTLYGAAGGGVAPALAAMGVTPGDIGAVFLSHLHGDHIGGLLDQTYPKARLYLSAAEARYWSTQDHPAARLLAENAARITQLADGDTIAPGLRVWSLPGHTPGQAGLVIDDQVAVVGDIMHRADIQLPDPMINTKFDLDPEQARQTRHSALAQIAAQGLVFCGGHIRAAGQEDTQDGQAFLRLHPDGSGWRAVPA